MPLGILFLSLGYNLTAGGLGRGGFFDLRHILNWGFGGVGGHSGRLGDIINNRGLFGRATGWCNPIGLNRGASVETSGNIMAASICGAGVAHRVL